MALYKNKYRIPSTRLSGWDYSSPGWYFVTVCTRARLPYLGLIETAQPSMSPPGDAAARFWAEIPQHFPHVETDAFVVMPNHVHGIVAITARPANAETGPSAVETRKFASLQTPARLNPGRSNAFGPLARGSLPEIVQAYKAAVTRWCRRNGHGDFAWQPRYYDHIIRDDDSLNSLREYIRDNPAKWQLDKDNPENLFM